MIDDILVSVIVPTYNQELVVEETMRALSKQSYNKMEFIISDDCSTDSTYDKLKACISLLEAKGNVVLHQQEKNSGITANYNWLFSHANGRIVVINEGDDISLPNRVEKIVSYFMKNNRCYLLQHEFNYLKNNEVLNRFSTMRTGMFGCKDYRMDIPFFAGCSMAFRRDLINIFPPFDIKTPWVDDALGRRGLLMNGFMQIDEKLLLYRISKSNTSSDGMGRGRKRLLFLSQDMKDVYFALKNKIIDWFIFCRIYCLLLFEVFITILNMSKIYRALRDIIKNEIISNYNNI